MTLRAQATPGTGFVTATMLSLSAGAMMQLWLADTIKQHGLGDGISFIICLSIMSGGCPAQRAQGGWMDTERLCGIWDSHVTHLGTASIYSDTMRAGNG